MPTNFSTHFQTLAILIGSAFDMVTLRIKAISNQSFSVTLSKNNVNGSGIYFWSIGI
nr:MAG TPA: hypothetical protein [Caudoviricetes sp.]